MKIALITDLHFGARNDNLAFSKYFERFYLEQFFPYLEEHNITSVLDLGDTFDRRKYINFNTFSLCKKYFFDQFVNRNIHLSMLCGNHDTFFKNTNKINAPQLLLSEYKDNITIYSEPKEITIKGDTKIALLPWICSGNYDESMEFINKTNAQILFGHLEISGFEMYRGSICEHGFNKNIFDKFDMVMTGHYHHKSSYNNIHYLGAPYEITWSDWNDPRGFHIFDTETRELEFIENKFKMFQKIYYDDSNTTIETLLNISESITDKMVKVLVQNKSNPYWFDMFISKIESMEPLDLQIIEDTLDIDFGEEDITENIEDTLTILKKYTEQYKDSVNLNKLNSFLIDLYHDALAME